MFWHKSLFSYAVFLALFGQAEASKAEISLFLISLFNFWAVLCYENISGSIFVCFQGHSNFSPFAFADPFVYSKYSEADAHDFLINKT